MLYQFERQPGNLYTVRVINSGGLESSHDYVTAGNKLKYRPVVDYRNIPSDQLFLSLGPCAIVFPLCAFRTKSKGEG